ncbi:hypothetical protein ACFL47_10940, partial [Candidatus Latescibacterota bacterium]
MKRRDFLKTSAAVSMSGISAAACSKRALQQQTTGPGFDVHPFVKEHPEAVFIAKTNIASKADAENIRSSAFDLSKELIVKTTSGGHPSSTRITVKPNWTCAGPKNGKPVFEKLG